MSLAKVEYNLSKRLKNFKSSKVSPIVHLEASESELLLTEIIGQFNSSNLNYNSSNYLLLDYMAPIIEMRNQYTIVATGLTDKNTQVGNIFDEKNSSFEAFCLSLQQSSFEFMLGSSTIKFDESEMNPAVLNILAQSFDKDLMYQQGYTTEMTGLSKLADFYATGASGIDFSAMNITALIALQTATVNPTKPLDFGNLKHHNMGRHTVENVFTQVLNNPNRVKFIGAPTFSCGLANYPLDAVFDIQKGSYVPALQTAVGGYSIGTRVFSNMKSVSADAASAEFGAITQTWQVEITEKILNPLLANPFVHGNEKPIALVRTCPQINININSNYVNQMFKISTEATNLQTVTTTMNSTKLLLRTWRTDLANEEDEHGSMRTVSFIPKQFNSLPPPVPLTYASRDSVLEFQYTYKPTSIEKYIVVFLDNQQYNNIPTNQYGSIHNNVANGTITQLALNGVSNYNFMQIDDFSIIVNNKDILKDYFAGNKSEKMRWLNEKTSQILKGHYNNAELLTLLEGKKRRLYLGTDPIKSGNSYITQQLQNYESGCSFIILDMAKILNLYTGGTYVAPLCDYSTGEVGITFNVSGKRRKIPSEIFNLSQWFVSLANTSALPPVGTEVLGRYQLQIFGLKLRAIEQDYETLKFSIYDVKSTVSQMAEAYEDLRNRPVVASDNDIELVGSGWFSDVFSFVRKNAPTVLKKIVDGTRMVKEFTNDKEGETMKKVNTFANTVSNLSKDHFGYGKPRITKKRDF